MPDFADLRPVQRRLVAELVDSEGVVVALGMGGGKTVTALTAIWHLRVEGHIRAATVLAPKRVALTTWPTEVAQWEHLRGLRVVVLKGSPSQRAKALAQPADVYVCGLDNVEWLLAAMPPDHPGRDQLVIDELSKLKSPRGARAKALLKAAPTFGAIWGLTGTPRPNGWEELWMQLQIVSKRNAFGPGGFDPWRRRHFMQMDFQGYVWSVTRPGEAEIRRVVDDWVVSVPTSETVDVPFTSGPGFDIAVPLTGEQRRAIDDMERHLMVEIGRPGATLDSVDPDDVAVIVALSSGVASGKISQAVQGFMYDDSGDVVTLSDGKKDALVELLGAVGGENVVVCYWYAEDLARIRAAVPDVAVLGSGTREAEADDIIRRWNGGEIAVLALHPASAGHGLNLQFGGARMVWYAMPWSSELYAQTVKRLARPGQTRPVLSHRIIADHPYERLRIARVERKLAEEQAFMADIKEVGE